MTSFKEWLLAEGEMTPTSQGFLAGRRRAEKNDDRNRYPLGTAKGPSHEFSDEAISDDGLAWILKRAQEGMSAQGISNLLWKKFKKKMSPEMISNKINVERTRGDIKPKFQGISKAVQIPRPDPSYWEITPEVAEIIARYHRPGMRAGLVQKYLKQQGHPINFDVLAKYLNELPGTF
jgi:hypothetical protein